MPVQTIAPVITAAVTSIEPLATIGVSSEVAGVSTSDLSLYMALISVVFSVVTAAISAFMPLLTQRSANKHTEKMKKLEISEGERRKALEALIQCSDIIFVVAGMDFTQVGEFVKALAGLIPYIEGEMLDAAIELYSDFAKSEDKFPENFYERSRQLIIETLKQFGEPIGQ